MVRRLLRLFAHEEDVVPSFRQLVYRTPVPEPGSIPQVKVAVFTFVL
jgi:hypothetical protein